MGVLYDLYIKTEKKKLYEKKLELAKEKAKKEKTENEIIKTQQNAIKR